MKWNRESFIKKVAQELLALSPSYNTYPFNKTIEEYYKCPQPTLSFLKDESEDLLIEFIRIAMSCEGSIFPEFPRNTVYPHLQFACSHPQLLNEWKKLLQRLGIISHILKSNKTWSGVKGLGIKRLDSIKRFIEIGGFIGGVKITGKSTYYKGILKNDLLKILIEMRDNSFQFPKEMNNKTKNEVIKSIIRNPENKNLWWKEGVEKPKLIKIAEKENLKREILSFIKSEIEKGRFPSWNILEDKYEVNLKNYFKNGLKGAYKELGINLNNRKEIMSARKQLLRKIIIEYVKESVNNGIYPSWLDIEKKFNVSYRIYFKSMVEVYEFAGLEYPRTIKKNMNL